jgi:hypothetical protein
MRQLSGSYIQKPDVFFIFDEPKQRLAKAERLRVLPAL